MATRHIYQMNRAVGVLGKGDKFTAEPDNPKVVSMVGAGYADLVMVEGDDSGAEIRGESGSDDPDSTEDGVQPRPDNQ